LEELENAHQSHAALLEREVREATSALLQQQHSLARAERLAVTGELAASVAHELRNPLASIQMALSNLREDATDPDVVERIGLINDEAIRVERLLNDILNSARHAPEPARMVHLSSLIGRLLALTRYQLPANVQLESEVPGDLSCRVPEDRLRQALLNLILNAAEVMEASGGKVLVAAETQADMVRITVTDEGPGFPPELLRNGSRAFVTTREGGTGLGLAIVRRFAHEVRGQLLLENRQPRGACATLLLPCQVDNA
jgi:signal transduction histidine kinase